jgi:hypothetical protein
MFAGAQQGGIRKFANAFDPHVSRPDSDLPAIYHGYWDLQPGEGLIVETPAPEGGYWSIQLANGLWNTLDYANRQASLNRAQAHVDTDGTLRAVVAHSDPGVANWLDTLGHQQGALLLRFMPPRIPGRPGRPRPRRSLLETKDDWMAGWAEDKDGARPAAGHLRPAARVVALSELDRHLPDATPRVTPAQRRRALDERLRQVTRLQRH